jgi:hypothetical protein
VVPGYQSTHLSHLERIPLDHGVWQPILPPLAITGFAVKAYSAGAAPHSPLLLRPFAV